MKNIILTKDTVLEEFKIFIERTEGEKTSIQSGNQLLFTLVQGGLIDQVRFANLFNRADADMIAKSMREFQSEKSQAANNLQNIQSQQVQVAQEQIEKQEQKATANQQALIDNDNANLQLDRDHEENLTVYKEDQKTERDKQKNKEEKE